MVGYSGSNFFKFKRIKTIHFSKVIYTNKNLLIFDMITPFLSFQASHYANEFSFDVWKPLHRMKPQA